VATIAGAVARIRQSKEPVAADPKLDHTANFLYMATGAKPDDFTARVMDISMILHADHGMNASTFTSMVVSSSLSDMYSAVTAGIGSLKGPLHGGANEKVIEILLGIKDPDKTETWVENALATKQKLMGFGHRVYKAYDPRARILGRYSKEVTALHNTKQLYEIATRMEKKVIDAKGEQGIFPNVDFYSGTIYYSLGYEPALFTPIFAVSRVAGWVARVLEYLPENRIFRPRALYKGPLEVAYVPMEKRA
jgi:citrate synthase